MEPVIIPIGSNWGGQGMLPVSQSYQYPDQRPVRENQEFADSLGPIFSMCSNMVEGEDIKMAKRWRKDHRRDPRICGYLSVTFPYRFTYQVDITGRLVLCHRFSISTSGRNPGPQAKSTGHYRVLSQEYLSASSSRPSHNTSCIQPFHFS